MATIPIINVVITILVKIGGYGHGGAAGTNIRNILITEKFYLAYFYCF